MVAYANSVGSAESPSLAERAYAAIRDMVVTLQIPPGAPVNEDGLSKRLGLGRTPIREALKRLESENLVVIYPRRGTFATEVNITDHGLIVDVRRQLEEHAAGRAAERATRADRASLTELLRTLRRPDGDPDDLMRLDSELHRAVYRCAHNRYLEATTSQYYNLSLRIWYLFRERLPDPATQIVEHVPLLEAIIAGDVERARAIAVEHVDHFAQSVRDAL